MESQELRGNLSDKLRTLGPVEVQIYDLNLKLVGTAMMPRDIDSSVHSSVHEVKARIAVGLR
jgi:hypothetical protein